MEKVVITEDLIKFYRYGHRISRFAPKKPFCKLCSYIDPKHRHRDRINYLKLGEEVYKVTFTNGREAYYHLACIDNPQTLNDKIRVENIRKYDVDRFKDVKAFISTLRKQSLTNSQIVAKIQKQYGCGRATAYRKLMAF